MGRRDTTKFINVHRDVHHKFEEEKNLIFSTSLVIIFLKKKKVKKINDVDEVRTRASEETGA